MPASLRMSTTAAMKTISDSFFLADRPVPPQRRAPVLADHSRPKAATSANDLFSTPTGDQETP